MEFLRFYQFRIPRNITFGLGAAETVGEKAKEYGANKALIVTDRVFGPVGIIEKVSQALSRTGVEPVVYDGVITEPTTEQVEEGLEVYQKIAAGW